MKKKKRLKNICVILLFIVFVSMFFPWMQCGDKVYSLFGFYKEACIQHNMAAMARQESIVYLLPYFLIFAVLAGILSGVKCILLIRNIHLRFLGDIIYALQLIYVATVLSFGGYLPYPAAFVAMIFTFAEFMVRKYAQEYEVFTREWEKQKSREKKEKEERKRRLGFPGRYDRLLFQVMWREASHQKKAVVLINTGNGILFGMMFILFALKSQFQEGYGITDALPSQGLNGILMNALIVVVVLYVFFEGIALYNYAGNQKPRRKMLWILGAREAVQTGIQITEYGLLIVFSLILGCLSGTVGYGIAAGLLRGVFGYSLPLTASFHIYAMTMGIYLFIACVTTFIVNDTFRRSLQGNKGNRSRAFSAERRYAVILFLAAILLLVCSFLEYVQRRNAENIYIVLIGFAGGAILAVFALTVQKSRSYCGKSEDFAHVMGKIPIQSGFLRNTGLRSGLFLFHVVFLAILSVAMAGNMAAPKAEQLCPYDYVCMAYEDDRTLFEEMSLEDGVKIQSYPITRVTTVQGDATDWIDVANDYYRRVIWPQGQHIGISESTYRALCAEQGILPKKLSLGEDDVYVIYQQDVSVKAHPLDWYMDRKTPYIRIGQPLRAYSFMLREQMYPPRETAGEDRQILTGCFQGGMQEDLVVFSDEYFESLEITEGPTLLYLINAKEGASKEIEKGLDIFAGRHGEDSSWSRAIQPYYSKVSKTADIRAERILQKAALSMEMVLLVMCIYLIQMMKTEFEKRERIRRFRLLSYIGIYRRDYEILLKRELRQAFYYPLLWAYGISVLVAAVTCYLRMMSAVESGRFIICLMMIWGLYFAVQWTLVRLNYKKMLRESL